MLEIGALGGVGLQVRVNAEQYQRASFSDTCSWFIKSLQFRDRAENLLQCRCAGGHPKRQSDDGVQRACTAPALNCLPVKQTTQAAASTSPSLRSTALATSARLPYTDQEVGPRAARLVHVSRL